ncbi:putative mitochondrial solute carrier [Aspergillus fijiensis CBS 313.89]|uniref:Putative mitochondrial solute carrier n=1 Tax=Aspergillus fijiensis CBS 313.89 TaxID=1448319 RepID=A0A8G1W538_9EURO|nr:putative mitochondrial solute carrier [Aspergillus fijiensis CBS 313.89]RAK80794.1 putative mitochondrial solute carrier [Aspergillus fijiensis CBS 313.89]
MTSKKQVSPWQSIVAGGAAGGFESLLTYPTEYLKTSQQLQTKKTNPLHLLLSTIRQHGLGHLYTGSMAFCVSNASKSGVRFFAFDTARKYMPVDAQGKVTSLGNLGAGMIAGVAESVAVVTPGETLKTKIIDDRAGAKQYRSAIHAIRTIAATEGVAGLYRGVVPVTMKQSANAMVRFTSYNFLLGQFRAWQLPSSLSTAGAGALAGVVTVYMTMPFDAIKTRLQAIGGLERYKGTLDCVQSVIRQEGITSLWRGTTPRLARLSVGSFPGYHLLVVECGSNADRSPVR